MRSAGGAGYTNTPTRMSALLWKVKSRSYALFNRKERNEARHLRLKKSSQKCVILGYGTVEERRETQRRRTLCTAIAEVVGKLRRILTTDCTDDTDSPYPCNPWLTSVAALPRCESLRLCVKSSPPASKVGYSRAKVQAQEFRRLGVITRWHSTFYILHSAFCIPRIISLSLAFLPLGVFALTAVFRIM